MANVGLMQLLANGVTAKLYYDFSDTQQFFLDGVIPPLAIPGTGPPPSLPGFSSGFSSGFTSPFAQSGSGGEFTSEFTFEFTEPGGTPSNLIFAGGTGLFMVSPQVAQAWIQAGQAANVYYNPFGQRNAQQFSSQPPSSNFGPPQ